MRNRTLGRGHRLRLASASRRGWLSGVSVLFPLLQPSPGDAQSADAVHLHIVIVEMHDRLTPTPHYNIVKQHTYEVEIHADKRITETVANADLTNGASHQDPGGNVEASLGQDFGVAWHVKGPSRLQRTDEGSGLISVWNIEITPNHECRIDVRMSLRPGLSVMPGHIAGTQTDATFNNWRVRHAECSVN